MAKHPGARGRAARRGASRWGAQRGRAAALFAGGARPRKEVSQARARAAGRPAGPGPARRALGAAAAPRRGRAGRAPGAVRPATCSGHQTGELKRQAAAGRRPRSLASQGRRRRARGGRGMPAYA